jgi:hypothetical protein
MSDFNGIKLEGEITPPPSFGDFRTSGEQFPGSLRSPTLKPARENPRKPAVHGAVDASEM